MSKLYIRGFGDEIDETQLKRQFGKKRIDRVDLIEKKDESGSVITRFCYLFTHTNDQAEAIVAKWDNRRWGGNLLSVKIARESFMERAAKLKQVKVAESNSSEFKPIFEAKQFAESSGSDSSSSESEEEDEVKSKPKRVATLSNASARLHDKVKSRKDADQRREEAIVQRQELYESRKKASFIGKKTTFSDSEEEDEAEPIKKGLFDGSDEEENELTLNLEGKLRAEHEGPDGAKLFQFERANFGGDNRFQMGVEFTADVAQMKAPSDIVSHPKPEKRNQFKAPTRFIPQRESEDVRERRLKDEIAELRREKEKYTNVKAPELEKTTHFGVTGSLAIGEENQEKEEKEGGFSLLSMFGRQVEPDEEEKENEKEEEMEVDKEEKEPTKQKPVEAKKGITFGGGSGGKFRLFPLTFDNTAFYMTPDSIDRQRNELKEEAAAEYGILSRQGKKRRARDDTLRGQSKVQQVLNWW